VQSYSASVDADGVRATREPGDAESLSDQAYLFATLAIWLIIGPASITAFTVWRNRKNRTQKR
jgi:small neutral amino acid transporter SnatA (MarC family)